MEEIRSDTRASGVRWVRALLTGIGVQMVLFALFWTVQALNPPDIVLRVGLVVVTLLLYVPAGLWAARVARQGHVLTGAFVGVGGIALYYVVVYIESTRGIVVFADAFTLFNLFDHALKVAAGAVGGFLVKRRAVP